MKPNSLRAGSLLFLGVISLAFSIAAQAGLPLAKSKGKAGEYMSAVVKDFKEDGKTVCERGAKKHVFDIRIFAESVRNEIQLNAP